MGKTSYKFAGPWKILESLPGGSYKIQHIMNPNKEDKKHSSHLSPLPQSLIPFPPLNGPDNSFQQLHKKYKDHPFLDAGIHGFEPTQPWQTANLSFLQEPEYHFPTLAELNADLNSDNSISNPVLDNSQVLGTSPSINKLIRTDHSNEPIAPFLLLGTTKSLSGMIAKIIQSEDKLFFVNYIHNGRKEWNLVQLNLSLTLVKSPSVFADGKFIVEFFVSHPDDIEYSHQNRRFWREFHTNLGGSRLYESYHLIKPSSNSDTYCKDKLLHPFQQWIHLNHPDVFIHGPFDFATIIGKKTADRLTQHDLEILSKAKDKYDNASPVLMMFQTSFHINTALHSEHDSQHVTNRVQAYNASIL